MKQRDRIINKTIDRCVKIARTIGNGHPKWSFQNWFAYFIVDEIEKEMRSKKKREKK